MKLSKLSVLLFIVFLPAVSWADVIINEVQVSPTGERFLELYNTGDSSVDLTGWYMQRKTATGSSFGSLISNPNFAGKTINGHGYFVISRSSLSNSSVVLSTLTLTESNIIQIKNSNGDVVNTLSWGSVSDCNNACPPNPPDGQSIQKTPSGWVIAIPTPGSVNGGSGGTSTTTENITYTNDSPSSESGSTNSSSDAGTYSSTVPLSDVGEKMEFEISAGRGRLTTVGSSLVFRAVVTKIQAVPEQGITYVWSFGDGTTGQGTNPSHAYRFPGEYEVVLNGSYSDQIAVSKTKVVVALANVSLARVSGGTQIANNSGVEINLEGWSLAEEKKSFIFPADTLIANSKKVIFADEVTGITSGDIELRNPAGKQMAFIASNESIPAMPVATSSPVALVDIQTKINEVKTKLAEISPALPLKPQPVVVDLPKPKPEATPATTTVQTQTATVFEAPSQTGVVNTIFAWPIRGFNFIKHLFVED